MISFSASRCPEARSRRYNFESSVNTPKSSNPRRRSSLRPSHSLSRIRALHIQAMKVTSEFFSLLGVESLRGRLFTASDDTPGNPHVVLLGDALWHNLFNRDPLAIGKSLRLDGSAYEIIGVIPSKLDAMFFPHPDVWIPAAIEPESRHREISLVRRLFDARPPPTTESPSITRVQQCRPQ